MITDNIMKLVYPLKQIYLKIKYVSNENAYVSIESNIQRSSFSSAFLSIRNICSIKIFFLIFFLCVDDKYSVSYKWNPLFGVQFFSSNLLQIFINYNLFHLFNFHDINKFIYLFINILCNYIERIGN